MDLYSFVVQNKDVFKAFYALIIILVCFLIVLKSHRLFKLSLYGGIRYFRNAFLFYGLAFFSRYFLNFLIPSKIAYALFEFFIIMAGLFLLYSLIWKKFEFSYSSLINLKTFVMYAFSLVITVLDIMTGKLYFMFASQILVFIFASALSYRNYLNNGKTQKFPKFYVFAMILALLVWALNTLANIVLAFNQALIINTYILNMLFFLLFLYGIVKVSRG